MPQKGNSRIKSIDLLLTGNNFHAGDVIARERETALRDLIAQSFFQPVDDDEGPYNVILSMQENRLVFRIKNDREKDMPMLVLSLKPYKRLIKDYFLIAGSYDKALRAGQPSRVEAIDMGRRSMHNEAGELLIERLEGKITMDLDTARRLFTLICILQANAPLEWR